MNEIIKTLSKNKKLLLKKRLDALVGATVSHAETRKSLVSYIVSDPGIEPNKIRARLSEALPSFMVPDHCVNLASIPRLPNGKIDHARLLQIPLTPSCKPIDQGSLSRTEEILKGIWEEVLRFSPVARTDNFFEIGGDSILSIQIVAKARKSGLILEPTQIFEHQTIEDLAAVAETEDAPRAVAKRFGPVDLIPIQHWFFDEHKNAPEHWNQGVIMTPCSRIDPDCFEHCVSKLVDRHETLRLVFPLSNKGHSAEILESGRKSFFYFDLSDRTGGSSSEMMERILADCQATFDLEAGPLFFAALFELPDVSQRICLVGHHLVVDPLSWELLVSDLEALYDSVLLDSPEPDPPQSYGYWADELKSKVSGLDLVKELEFWQLQKQEKPGLAELLDCELPLTENDVRRTLFRIDLEDIWGQKDQVPRNFEPILIASAFETLSRLFETDELCFGLERQLRLSDGLGASSAGIAGWFTSYFPLLLRYEAGAEGQNLTVASVEAKMSSVPSDGIGYGALRYMEHAHGNPELRQKPSVLINYLGKRSSIEARILGTPSPLREGMRSPLSERFHVFELNISFEHRALIVDLGFPRRAIDKAWLAEFHSVLESLVRKGILDSRSRYTVANQFSESGLDESDLEKLLGQIDK